MRAKAQRVTGTERRKQIIWVATELFARQGFKATTTRQIAQQARINEAIIFRHFPHKEDLDWTIIDQQCCILIADHIHQGVSLAGGPRAGGARVPGYD